MHNFVACSNTKTITTKQKLTKVSAIEINAGNTQDITLLQNNDGKERQKITLHTKHIQQIQSSLFVVVFHQCSVVGQSSNMFSFSCLVSILFTGLSLLKMKFYSNILSLVQYKHILKIQYFSNLLFNLSVQLFGKFSQKCG